MYFVYILIDPRNNNVQYVGITSDIYARFSQHLRCDSNNISKNIWISELKALNQMVVMQTLEEVETIERARERETDLIRYYHSVNPNLLNLTGAKSITFSDFMAHFQDREESDIPGDDSSEQDEMGETQVVAKRIETNGDITKRIRRILRKDPDIKVTELARRAKVSRSYAGKKRKEILENIQQVEK